MDFRTELLLRLGFAPDVVVKDRVTVFDGRGIAVEGHDGFYEYGASRIVLRLKAREYLIIKGEKLSVREVNPSEVLITGKIAEVVRNEKPDTD